MANANYCPPPIIYHKKQIPPIRPAELKSKQLKPVAEFNQAYKSQYAMTKAQITQGKKGGNQEQTLRVSPE